MPKYFNTTAICRPQEHYMVDITEKLKQIKQMIDAGQYFTINRARQYGKTTTLRALQDFLKDEYIVLSLDFQMLSSADFSTEMAFVDAFSGELLDACEEIPDMISDSLNNLMGKGTLSMLFRILSKWCRISPRGIVLIIDEVDNASNNQIFLDFLAQIRGYYINRDLKATFQSVILSSVYDIKNLKQKFENGEEIRRNSPWNIAADFLVDMSFSAKEIEGMLNEYESDYQTGMDVEASADLIYDYTSGYPFLVSKLCKLIDERVAGSKNFPNKTEAWTKNGIIEAVKLLLNEKNTLFESLVNKIQDYPQLHEMIYELLFNGKAILYNSLNPSIEAAEMFGFIKNNDGQVIVANRIFETVLYNLFLAEEAVNSSIAKAGFLDKNQFISYGHLNMRLVLEKFVTHFDDLFGDRTEKFMEEDGRRYFLLYLRPIINGTGNYYIESRTRNMERTDVIVDYLGEQFIIELKIWRGDAYNTRGEKQLWDYLSYYHLDEGYMLSFNFNKNKKIGVKELHLNGKILIEATV